MIDILLDLLSPPPAALTSETRRALAGVHDWAGFCATVERANIAARVYDRLRSHSEIIPVDVSHWFAAQCARTASWNLRLTKELGAIFSALRESDIPALSLKGPALAYWSGGLLVRPFRDLDILVKPGHLPRASALLREFGFSDLPVRAASHHKVYARPGTDLATVLELHFDLYDAERAVLPDIEGLWDRAVEVEIGGYYRLASPSLTDHLLLAIMQLPHHYWSPSLFADVGDIVWRWPHAIDWDAMFMRSSQWGMRALTGAVLYAVGALLRVPLPDTARTFVQPGQTFHRLQWRLVREGLYERLAGRTAGVSRVASWLIGDRSRSATIIRSHLTQLGGDAEAGTIPHTLAMGVSCLSSLVRVLLRSEYPCGTMTRARRAW